MSLPDTVFIFVLALIIFGPKKLPEIGRQLGKLVGEFRRASNEFKFQIEEELRQAELADRNTVTPAKKELETSSSEEPSADKGDSPAPDSPYSEETLPVGQYPNIDTVNPQDLKNPVDPVVQETQSASTSEPNHSEDTFDVPAVQAATGTEARTVPPYTSATAESGPSAPGEASPTLEHHSPSNHTSPSPDEEAQHNHESADPYAAPAVADVTHG